MISLSKTLGGATSAFRKAFKRELEEFADLDYTRLYSEIAVDLVKLDDWLHTMEDYEERGLSMEEFISERFGDEATEVIRQLLPQHR